MRRLQAHTACVRRPLLQHLLRLAVAVTAVVLCTAAPMPADSPLFSGNKTDSPFEQEEERESAEESPEVYAAGRKLLRWKSDQRTRQGVSAQFALSGNRRRHCFAGCFDGHRLANGLTAPLVR